MNKYNNFSRAPSGESANRFNKRPRYGGNNSGVGGGGGGKMNNSPRYKHHQQTGYQHSLNRNHLGESFQSNHYDKHSRHYYGISPNRSSNNANIMSNSRQSSPYTHNKSSPLSCSSPSSSLLKPFSSTTQCGVPSPSSMPFSPSGQRSIPPSQPKTQANSLSLASTTISAQTANNQNQTTAHVSDNTNYFAYNYYPGGFNEDLNTTATSSPFGVADNINPFMWHTITSTPPPKLPIQQLPQPPLPQELPPQPPLPPLPDADKLQHLQPPPPIPASLKVASSATYSAKRNDKEFATKTIVTMKAKRKAMSTRYKQSKAWTEEDALLALKTEERNTMKQQKDIILIIRFPDPELSREMVKCYSPDIESVHFQLNFSPRHCLVHLRPGTDVEKTIDHLSKIPFGTGFLSVEIKAIPPKVHSTKLSEIDPFTLYVGNLPTTIASKTLKQHFPGAARIDIGFAQRMKYTRYAFIRYKTVHQAIDAYTRMLDAEISGRTLTMRFRRLIPANDGNKDGEDGQDCQDGQDVDNLDNMHDEQLLSQTEATLNDNSKTLSQTNNEKNQTITDLQENSSDIVQPSSSQKDSSDLNKNTNDINDPSSSQNDTNDFNKNITENSPKETMSNENNCIGPTSTIESEATPAQDNDNTLLLNIKPDPDIDPEDVVIRDNSITSRFECTSNNIKKEDELALYTEFFEPPNKQNDDNTENTRKSSSHDVISLPSTTDETDDTLSTNSLGEFLQNCQRSQAQSNNNKNTQSSPEKRSRTSCLNIKTEPMESENLESGRNPTNLTKDSVLESNIKQEPTEITGNLNLNDTNSPTAAKPTENTNSETNKTVPRRKDKAAMSVTHSQSNTNNNDDIVPSTAIFFRNNNSLASSRNMCEYDEFYETSLKTLNNIKPEPIDISTSRRRTPETEKYVPQNEVRDVGVSHQNYNTNVSNKTAESNIFEDDNDLVPAQNILGTYRPQQSCFKQEREHDDLFSVPLTETNQSNDNNILKRLSNNHDTDVNCTNRSTPVSNSSETVADSDDDVQIISENISTKPKQTNCKTSFPNNSLFYRQTDLTTFKSKPMSIPFPCVTVSKILHDDNLDKLYDQLDADSDSDL